MKLNHRRAIGIMAAATLTIPLLLTAQASGPTTCWDKYWTICNGGKPTRSITTTYTSSSLTNSWGGSTITISLPNAKCSGNPVPQMRFGSTYKNKIRGSFACVYTGNGTDTYGNYFQDVVVVLREDGEMDGEGGTCN